MPSPSSFPSGRLENRLVMWPRLAYEYLVLYFGLLLCGLTFLTWSLAATVLHPLLPRRFGARLGRFAIMAIFRSLVSLLNASGLIKCELSALDSLRGQGALIIACNHPSMLDAMLVTSRLPNAVCIVKADIWNNLLLRGGARLAAYICNDSPFTLIRLAAAAVRAGDQLLVFPEGTRTRQRPVDDFKGGFALIAKSAGIPVQTVFIETNSPYLSKGWPLYRKPEFPLIYRARLGQRFEVDGDVKSFVVDLECYYRQSMAAGNPARAGTTH